MSERLPFRASINATYAIFFKHPVRFTLLALPVPIGIVVWFVAASSMASATIEDGRNRSPLILALFALQYAIFILCMSAMICGAQQVLRGRRMLVTEAFRAAFRRLFQMLATSIPILMTGLLLLYSSMAFTSLAWMLAGICLGILDLTVLSLSMPICMLERRSPLASLAESLRVTRGSRLRFLAAAWVALLPIGIATWIFRVAGNSLVNGVMTMLVNAWDIVALSILSVVALQVLSSPKPVSPEPSDKVSDIAI